MTPLFISLYLDEDVSVLVAKLLRARGFAALTVQETGRKGLSDEEQLEYAVASGRVLLTHNRRHFERLAGEYAGSGKKHLGIIIAVRRRPNEIASRLLPLLNQVTADEMVDQVRYV